MVSSPGHFAGTIAGLVFMWRIAILVDSFDIVLVSACCKPLASVLPELWCV